MENREILFRGIRKDSREWVEGIPIESNMNGEGYETFMYVDYTVPNTISLVVGGGYFGRCVEVIPETVGQFTGLLDKNGTKIFEGDVAEFTLSDGKKRVGIIKYNFDGFDIVDGRDECSIRGFRRGFSKDNPVANLTTIYTIHDHLLKGE